MCNTNTPSTYVRGLAPGNGGDIYLSAINGEIEKFENLVELLDKTRKEYDAIAITSKIKVPRDTHRNYFLTDMINPWGGIEAMREIKDIKATYQITSNGDIMIENIRMDGKRSLLTICVLTILTLSISGCLQQGDIEDKKSEIGFLEGNVTFSQCLEKSDDDPCPASPESYKAREILVFTHDGHTLMNRTPLDENGNFRISLTPGKYLMDITRLGIDKTKDVPMTIEIRKGETVRLNITLDTGIR